jgi:hypothetical protein
MMMMKKEGRREKMKKKKEEEEEEEEEERRKRKLLLIIKVTHKKCNKNIESKKMEIPHTSFLVYFLGFNLLHKVRCLTQ